MKTCLLRLGLILAMIGVPALCEAAPQKAALGLGPKLSGASPMLKSKSGGKLSILLAGMGTFWRSPDVIQSLGLTAEQQKKMDDIFQQHRLKLIDLTAALEKEELILEPFVTGGRRPTAGEEAKVLAQFDRIADARAELEKTNSKMLFSLLQVLTEDQWTRLPTGSRKLLDLKKKGLK